MAGADIAAEVMWALDGFGVLITVGALWFSYGLWKYDREQEEKRRRKRRKRCDADSP